METVLAGVACDIVMACVTDGSYEFNKLKHHEKQKQVSGGITI